MFEMMETGEGEKERRGREGWRLGRMEGGREGGGQVKEKEKEEGERQRENRKRKRKTEGKRQTESNHGAYFSECSLC